MYSSSSTTEATLRDILTIAQNITQITQHIVGNANTRTTTSTFDAPAAGIPDFCSPEPLTSQLVAITLPQGLAESMSQAYILKADELRVVSQQIALNTCAQLATLPQTSGTTPLEILQRKVYDAHHRKYESTLALWAGQAMDLARTRLACTNEKRKFPASEQRRQFKSEYLPLFEFAFEKDRFPNREDKKHLAKISGMSYRQVCVWFQNRRCRHSSRAKSLQFTPAPKTFEEMKERLSVSAREALNKSPLAATTGACTGPHYLPAAPTLLGKNVAQVPIWSPKEENVTASLRSSERATLLGASELTEDRFDYESRDEMDGGDHDDMPTPMLPSFAFNQTSAARLTHPLNSFKTPTTTVFPAVYKPSKPTYDPFVMEHEPWLRSARGPRTRELIELTPEVLEDMMQRFDSMEVDVPVFESEELTSSTHGDSTERLEILSPRRPTAPRSFPKSHTLTQRTFSSSSSESWTSGPSVPLSRSSSYSTALSSVLSSPQYPEASLPTPGECAVESPSEYVSSPSSPSADEGPVCDILADDEATQAGPFDLPSMKPASKARVDAWMSNVSTQRDDDTAESKWEQLLAAAVEAAPQSCA